VIRASALRIELTDSSDDCLIRVHGEIDLDNIDAFESAFAAAFDSGVPLVLLDLSNVTFCAACGIGILLSWHHEMEAHGRTLVICTPSRIVRRVFALTGADAVVEVR
jgi:anti-sigma B factor antagonist